VCPVPVAGKLPQIGLHVRPESVSLFRAIVPDKLINRLVSESGVVFRKRLYSPLVTFWGMIAQCLDNDHSCANATARVVEWLRARKAPGQRRDRRVGNPSPGNSSYTRARQRMPASLLPTVAKHVGQQLLAQVPEVDKLWQRDIFLVDATTVSMPDEPELVGEFGKGRGGTAGTEHAFPLARTSALISLTRGAVMDAAIGGYGDSEHALFHELWRHAPWLRGSVVVGDSLYGSYAHLALLQGEGIDLITRPFGNRLTDLRKGKRLGKGDRLVIWHRDTKQWPWWLDRATMLPDTLTLRLIEVTTLCRTNRPERIVLVTTLTDHTKYKAKDIAGLYLQRWDIEVDLRHLKTVLGMDVLRGRTPDIVRKEIWAFLATYNLIRTVMWEAGTSHDIPPSGLEFQRDAPTAQYLASADRKRPIFKIGAAQGD
jgi:hypothetical protein